MRLICAIIALVFALFMILAPGSPGWLVPGAIIALAVGLVVDGGVPWAKG